MHALVNHPAPADLPAAAVSPASGRRPRLGLILEHYSGRNDVREFVDQIGATADIVLFGTESMLDSVDRKFEKRPFRARRSAGAAFWTQVFNVVGRIPRSQDNFLVTETFKLARLAPLRRRVATARLQLRLALPRPMSFDFLLRRLAHSDLTEIDDIDRFLVITELSSPAFLARVHASDKPVDAYVYSWDHPCKHARVSSGIDTWFVWHEGIAQDLADLQSVPIERTRSVGSTQLCYVREYLATPELQVPRRADRYVYYGCGTGEPVTARQEARLIGFLADALGCVDPELKLLVRPYPFLTDTAFFSILRDKPNVELDAGYRVGRTDFSLHRQDIFERLNLQDHAVAFAHCGTTMGLEGAYLSAPILFLDLHDFDYGVPTSHFLHLQKFIHQFHNEKYMLREGFQNVVKRSSDLQPALRRLLAAPGEFHRYNQKIASDTPLRSMDDIVADVLARLLAQDRRKS